MKLKQTNDKHERLIYNFIKLLKNKITITTIGNFIYFECFEHLGLKNWLLILNAYKL